MPVELFDHDRIAISRELPKLGSEHQHFFGGCAGQYGIRIVNAECPCHIVYLLDTADALVPISVSNIRFLPLVYGFQCNTNGGALIYRVLNEQEIEVIAPDPLEFIKDFPYPDYPSHFAKSAVSFEQCVHEQQVAEAALAYQGVFGIDQLSESEMKRAVKIARSTWGSEAFENSDWTAEQSVRNLGCAPFYQDKPSRRCDNPNCTAEVEEVFEAEEIELPPDLAELLGEPTMQTEEYVIRVPTLKVVAIHQPNDDDETMWGSPYFQLIWQLCGECGCLTVNHQCT